MFRTRWSLCLLAIYLCFATTNAPSARAAEIVLACVDCYGSSALYPVVSKTHFGEHTIRWIHVKTEKFMSRSQKRDLRVTAGYYEQLLEVDMDNDEDVRRVADELQRAGVTRVIGGMETGAFQSDIFNFMLQIPGNDPTTRDLRRAKKPMAEALDDMGIPSLLSGDLDEIEKFIDGLTSEFIVIKPNRSSGSEGLEFVRRDDRARLREVVREHQSHPDKYGNPMDQVIIQPAIVGVEYVANTFRDGTNTYLVGAWRYLKVRAPGSQKLVYFIDRPVDPGSPIGLELAKMAPEIHRRLGNQIGPGHAELMRESTTGDWYVIEQAARVAGTGVPAVEAEIWGTSHLHLNIAFSLGPEAFQKELAKARAFRTKDAAIFNFVAVAAGNLSPSGVEALENRPTYFKPFEIFRPDVREPVSETFDLASSPFVAAFTGTDVAVAEDIDGVIASQLNGELFTYETPQCATTLHRLGQLERSMHDARTLLY